ncbi:hypothetical protein A3A63_00790 [Candidatus Gottesmanbacteria bacterium RIFCSPLOWO2_01_FULL_46_9]|uniref:Glycosyltransferase RgtA/B/C/D-like domain-containing protein n=1 Tax=Candidatus Gottesmanbacteria bacterium RIFCSPLOWO2_01_FULL_46_9 TaxID=1798394 RepID=A0A1F6B345_9BACT|nr:MAG: hypothetical protein A3A63_00790 [Candidatus Gottesmanbacteria bacterium RIFCSPLOWO2_01_FULL_46_9]
MRKRFFWTLLFAAIFLLGLAMRSPEIVRGNYLFGFDQGRDYIGAYSIAVLHKMTLIGAEVGAGSAGIQGIFHGPGYYYLLAFMHLVFRGDPYGGLVLMFAFGVGTLLVVFVTVKKMFNERVALIALFLVSIAPLIAPQSRFIWNHHPTSLFIALWLYGMYKVIDQPRLYAPLAVFISGLAYHFELAMAIPLVLTTFVAVFFVFRIFDKRVIIWMVIAAFVAFSPMIAFEARHGFMATRGALSHLTTQRHIQSTSAIDAHNGQWFLAQKRDVFIAMVRDSFVFDAGFISPSHIMITIVFIEFLIGWCTVMTKDKRVKKYFLAIFCAFPVSILIFLPLRNAVWTYYLIHLQFIVLYAFAFSSWRILEEALRKPQYGVALLFVIYFFLSMGRGAFFRLKLNWYVDYPDYGGREKILGKRAVIDYMYADAKGKPFSAFIFTPPVYTWPYDYLFLTYAKEKYGYMPNHEKKGLAYMIIEIDGTNYWSYKGWLETVIKDGDVVWERYLQKSDHLLQKRLFR